MKKIIGQIVRVEQDYMNKVKIRLITLAALVAAFVLVLGAALGLAVPSKGVSAADYAPSGIFSAGAGGEVKAFKAQQGEDEPAYTAFVLSDEGKMYFRRDLALKWYVKSEAESGSLANPGKAQYFSIAVNFPAIEFEKLTLAFESAEENISKEGKATNSLVFEATETGAEVYIKDAAHQKDEEFIPSKKIAIAAKQDVKIAFTGDKNGAFAVEINGEEAGLFTNIGGYFLEYLSSASSTPRIPMTFTAELPEAEEGETQVAQKILLKELNGQSFALKNGTDAKNPDGTVKVEEDGTVAVTGGRVEDDTPPVLVFNQKVYAFTLGQKYSLTYEAIDVCDETVSVTRQYYMYKSDVTEPEYKSLNTSTYFLRQSDDSTREYVSVRFELDDGRTKAEGADPDYVYLTWYAAESAVVKQTEGETKKDFMLVDTERTGPEYSCIETDASDADNPVSKLTADAQDKIEAYQQAVEEAASTAKAGKGAYFYLPSLRGLISSACADYRDLRFSIYYHKPGQSESASYSSATTLNYNALRFEIDKMGTYSFRVIAADKSGNEMKLYIDGEWVTVTSSNIDDTVIPEFHFTVGYDGAVIEDPGEKSLGYRDSSYTIDSFEVIALEGYLQDYTLYRFDESKYTAGNLSYSDMVLHPENYLDYLTEIQKYNSEVSEDDAAWDRTDNDYNWNPDSSLSFRPQESGFYFVKLVVTDAQLPKNEATAYQVIEVRNPIDVTPGETYWLENNITSIVLFSVSAVLAIVIVVLFVVKPSEKKVEEVDLEKLKGRRKK